MALVTFNAYPATRDGAFLSISLCINPAGLFGREQAPITDVKQAIAHMHDFANRVEAAKGKGFVVSALWPRSERKPRGWDKTLPQYIERLSVEG